MHQKPGGFDRHGQFSLDCAGAAEGGELFNKIIEKTKLNEAEAKLHFFQIALAIKYLQFKKICHRYLKPGTVLGPTRGVQKDGSK